MNGKYHRSIVLVIREAKRALRDGSEIVLPTATTGQVLARELDLL